MRIQKILSSTAILLALTVSLASCKSADERAEEHYQSGLALIENGDFDRGVVELRNVFQLNGSHQAARHKLAEILLDHYGSQGEAYGQYLRLVEQYPDDLEARIVLSEIAFETSNWDEFERHGNKAEELDPDTPRVKAISVARAYRAAALNEDNSAIRDQARAARDLLETQPESRVLRTILIDGHVREGEFTEALAGVNWVLERDPENLRLWRQRLGLLAQLEDMEAIELQLRDMVERFPDDPANKQAMIRFYMARGEVDNVEEFLRELIAAEPEGVAPVVNLIQFLSEVRSPQDAIVEIEKAIAERPDPVPFHVMRATLEFQLGNRDQAIETLEAVLARSEPSDQTRSIKVTLSRMLVTMNNVVAARALIEEVLAEDPSQAEALKVRAAWQIEADDTDGAIAALRVALDQSPEDSDAMTLMAKAYTRSGRPELARDLLALAVEASGNAPTETIRYARMLLEEERYLPAEDILLPALRLAPQNIEILLTLGQLYLGMEDFGRAEQVVKTLRGIDTPESILAANGLEAERLNRQSGPEEAMSYLEGIANSADATLASKIALVRARLATRDTEGALGMAREILAEDPENPAIKAIVATTEAVNGNLEVAETLYRELLDDNPKATSLWLELSRLKMRQGDPAAARAIVDEAILKMPDDPNMLWAKASYMERDGDIEGAIGIYEELYSRNSGVVVIANNLASLLSTYREDPESLERAWTIARRFSETEVPAMQDTYGWIEHRRNNFEAALSYLESAAAGLPNDPVVQYHLGQTYLALQRSEDALRQFRLAIKLAGPADRRAQIEDARAQVVALQEAISGE